MKPRHAILWVAAALWGPASALGYEVVEVAGAGALRGTVRVEHRGLRDEMLTVRKDADYCGASLPAEKYLVSPEGRLQNAVVMLEGIERGKPFAPAGELSITNEKCRFVPHVMVAPQGATVQIRNDDPILHTVHYYHVGDERERHVVNLAQPKQGLVTSQERILRTPGLLHVICNLHVFMEAWAWVVEHPYAVVTRADGSFALDRVPPGTYTLRVWHEALGEKSVEVTIEPGRTASIDLTL